MENTKTIKIMKRDNRVIGMFKNPKTNENEIVTFDALFDFINECGGRIGEYTIDQLCNPIYPSPMILHFDFEPYTGESLNWKEIRTMMNALYKHYNKND